MNSHDRRHIKRLLEEVKDGEKTHSEIKDAPKGHPPYWSELRLRFRNLLRKPKFLLQLITLLALVVYTGGTYWTNYLTKRALANARDENRPYIFADALFPNPFLVPGSQSVITVTIHNAGVSPALNIVQDGHLVVGGTEVFNEAAKCSLTFPDANGDSAFNLPPRQAASEAFALPSFTSAVLDQAQIDRIVQGKEALMVYGAVKYTGIGGGDYRTGYCWIYLPSGMHAGRCSVCSGLK
jgi:hypothetical protein